MSQNKNRRQFKKPFINKNYNSKQRDETAAVIDESNPVIIAFRQIALELDDKHDRYERIVKLSRDITIESKRIIFLLHTVDIKKDNEKNLLADAKQRLDALCINNFKLIAQELKGLDPYQYARAYSAGLQEFIEAYSFYEYISGINLSAWDALGRSLTYKVDDESDEEIKCLVQPIEFMLGLADTTGEVMRRGVNALGTGNTTICFESSQFLQQLYTGYLKIAGTAYSKDMSRKITTLRQSLLKTEMVCYNIKVRGVEAAVWGSDNAANIAELNEDEDEGFY